MSWRHAAFTLLVILATASTGRAQGLRPINDATLINVGPGFIEIMEGTAAKRYVVNATASVRIFKEIPLADIPVGANVVLSGFWYQGDSNPKFCHVEWYLQPSPSPVPPSFFYPRDPNEPKRTPVSGKSRWMLNLLGTVTGQNPCKILVAQQNRFVHGDGGMPYTGPTPAGQTVTIDQAAEVRKMPGKSPHEVILGESWDALAAAGAKPQVSAGYDAATQTIRGVRIRRVEPLPMTPPPAKK